MITQIPDILTQAELDAIREALGEPDESESLWQCDAETAAGAAKSVKNNLQTNLSHATTKAIVEKVRTACFGHHIFAAATRPKDFCRLMINAYKTDMSYGNHVDAPYIDHQRTDISMTLFISPPQSYEGGELILQSAASEISVKGDAGSVILYPASYVHRVNPIKSGIRIAVVGWLTSFFRHAHHRELMFEFDQALSELKSTNSHQETIDRLMNIRFNLTREWGE